MNRTDRQAHWDNVYSTNGEAEVGWFQETPAPSLELIALVGAIRQSAIIDIGAALRVSSIISFPT
jgi:hypothetical protein